MFMLFVSTVDLGEGDNREILTGTTLPWILDAALLASSTTWCGGRFETLSPAAMAVAPETRDGGTRLNQEPSFMATSTLVRTLNAALRDGNAAAVSAQLGSLRDPNVLLELANDDWVKEADVHLDPLILMGKGILSLQLHLLHCIGLHLSLRYKRDRQVTLQTVHYVTTPPQAIVVASELKYSNSRWDPRIDDS